MILIPAATSQVDELTATIWLARTATPRRFHNAKALLAYCSLDPSLKISAGNVTGAVMHSLSFSGTVIDRTRLMVLHDNPTTEIAPCAVQEFYVDDYTTS